MRKVRAYVAIVLCWQLVLSALGPIEVHAVDPVDDADEKSSVSANSQSLLLSASQIIVSDGPLTAIGISEDLNCSVGYVTDDHGEFYGDTACATLVAVEGSLFGPAEIPAGGGAEPRTAFTPVSQSEVTGQGFASDPYALVTVVDAGTSGLRVEETDTYVVGAESYSTSLEISNSGIAAKTLIIYRAGDCYLQDSDNGFGASDNITGAVACVEGIQQPDGSRIPGPRRLEWLPITPGSHYFEEHYSTVWGRIGSQTNFPDTSRDSDFVDNGAGLSWEVTVPAGSDVTVAHTTTFSPTLASGQVCAGEDMSGPPVEPSATPGVRVEYDPRYIVDERRPDYLAEAERIATTIRDRAQTTLARYAALGFEVAPEVTVRIKCSPAFYGVFHPGRRGIAQSDHEVELLSDYVRTEFAADVVAFTGGTWSPPPGGWTNLIDHELFHTVQYRMGFPVQTAALGGDPVTLESTPGTAQDLVDLERDDSDLVDELFSYLSTVRQLSRSPHPAIDETNAEYASPVVFQYWGERFGPQVQLNLEQRVASFLEVMLAGPDDRLTAMGRALDYDWASNAYRPIVKLGPEQRAFNALRDFYVAAYATSAQNAAAFNQYAILDDLIGHGGTGGGSRYPVWELDGTTPIGPSGAVFSDLSLARAQGGTWEFGVPSGAAEVLVQIATAEAGLVGQDAPLRVGVVRKNTNGTGTADDVISINPTLFRAGPIGGSILDVPIPIAGYDTVAIAVVAGSRPVHFNLTAQVSSVVDLTIQSPTAQGELVVTQPEQLVYAEVIPTRDGQFQRGLTAASFRAWVGGQEATVRFTPELEMLGMYVLYSELPAGLTDGTYDLEIEWNGQRRTSPDSVIVDLGQSSSFFSATAPNHFMNAVASGGAGMPLLIHAGLWSNATNVTGADVRATITAPGGATRTTQIPDLGMPADGGLDDGLYGAMWWATTASGTYTVTIDASGIDDNGEAWSVTDVRELTLGASTDGDGDGIVDGTEIMVGLDPADPTDGSVDADGDGLSLAQELALATDPWSWDTDGGGESDSSELAAGRAATIPSDDVLQPAVRLALTPEDGRTVAIHVETETLSGSVRLQRRSGEQTADLGTFSGAGADLIDGPLVEGEYEYLATSVGSDGAEAPPKAYGPIRVADDVTPPLVRISLNEGTWVTADRMVSVALVDLSEAVGEMRVAASADALASTAWTPYANLATVEIPAVIGEHIVAAQVRDSAGHESEVATAPVFLEDARPPDSSVATLQPNYSTPNIDVPYTATDDLSGVETVELWWRHRATAEGTWSEWTLGPSGEAGPASPPISFDFAAGGGDYEFYTIATDIAGNVEDSPASADAVTRFEDAAWPPSVRVNNDAGAQTQQERPAVVIAPDGAVYAIWDDMRNGNQTDVYFSRRDPATGTWGPNQKVNNDTTTRAQYLAHVAVDGSNNAYAVWHDQREGNQSGDANIYFAKRPAGTGTWGANLRVNNDTRGASQSAPRIAVTDAGAAVAVWVDRRSSQWNIYSSRLPAGSSTWGANLRVTDNTSSRKDAPDVAIAPDGTAYAVWEDERSGNWDIYWSKLTPGSSTWTANAKLSDDPGTFAQYSPAVGSDAAGNVLAAWLDDRVPDTEVRARRLAAGGTWGVSQVASDGATELPSGLALGVAPSGQALAVWADGRGTSWDIWGAEYNPTSQQWSVSRMISDDPGASHQLRPAVAVRGNISVAAWFDARESYFGDIRATIR